MIENCDVRTLSKFSGLFDRGEIEDVPSDHLSICNNCQFTSQGVTHRGGLSLFITKSNILRTHLYERTGYDPKLLVLCQGSTQGELFDSTSFASPILAITGMIDFSVVVINNIAYITPHNKVTGLQNEYIYIYTGSGTARRAGGTQPTFTTLAANSATAGNVEHGRHLFTAAAVYGTGFIGLPSASPATQLNVTGGFKVDISGLPSLPSGAVSWQILATKIIGLPSDTSTIADVTNQSYFFVPNATVTSGSTITINFFDADLIESADYLWEQFANIPAGVCITFFNNRLIIGGEYANPNVVRASSPVAGQFESFNQVEGFQVIDSNTVGGVQNLVVCRQQLHIIKKNSAYATVGSTDEAIYWEGVEIDASIGTGPHGIATILGKDGAIIDKFFIASYQGIMLFNGIYQEELTWKIAEVWRRVNKVYFFNIQMVVDTYNKKLYCIVPLDSATACSHILYGDYQLGLDSKNIQWSIWSFPNSTIPSITAMVEFSNPEILISQPNNIYTPTSGIYNDYGTAIDQTIQSAYLPGPNNGRQIQAAGVRLRLVGAGTATVTISSLDINASQSVSTPLATAPGFSTFNQCNVIGERMAVKIRTNTDAYYFNLKTLSLFYKFLWAIKPN